MMPCRGFTRSESDANNEGLQAKSGLQGCMVGPNFLNKVTTQGTTERGRLPNNESEREPLSDFI